MTKPASRLFAGQERRKGKKEEEQAINDLNDNANGSTCHMAGK